ncbi:MAG: IS1634 family transposase [Waddliaceae bacterium]
MFISRSKFKTKSGKIYEAVLLRESYRENGRVKKRTIANLSRCSEQEIAAIELALTHKHDLTALGSLSGSVSIKEGASIGGVWVIYQIAKKLGIIETLGNSQNGKLALWQVIARVLEQGSRLSAVRLGETYAIASALSLKKGFTEDALYKNLAWLADNQTKIEDKLFVKNKRDTNLFLYDVTSSYLEGTENALAEWGYNRDGKKGKKQIVVGLLADSDGNPISSEVFAGNTNDLATFHSQVEKAKQRFGCERVTFVGDRGMIKSGQIKDLKQHGFHYITALTKKQIKTLVKKQVIQYELFDSPVCEVTDGAVRYIFRRNPVRAQEIKEKRESKKCLVERFAQEQSQYLQEHSRAKEATVLKRITTKIKKLEIAGWLSIKVEDRKATIYVDEETLSKEAELDGCYVIKTDLRKEECETQTVHDRYKDLALVESAFRTCKSSLELRPVHVRLEKSTYGHVLVVMLAYMIIRHLDQQWASLYLTVEEGLRSLNTLTLQEVTVNGHAPFQQIPEPRKQNKKMPEILGVELPKILPKSNACVVTRKKRRKPVLRN